MWDIEPLQNRHDRSQFDCGETLLDDWIRTKATQWTRKGLSRVFVATRDDSNRVVGYYTLSNHSVEYDSFPPAAAKGLPRIRVPAVLLGRLAVDGSVAGRGLGNALLFNAMARSVMVADHVGAAVFEVHALHERAREFYFHHGLRSLQDDQNHLFLSLKEIRKLDLPPVCP